MKIQLRGNRVGIEKFKKSSNTEGFLIMPKGDGEEYFGTILYLGEQASKDLVVGQEVYFGTLHQLVRMAGAEICVMEDSNVLAISRDQKV